MYKPHQVCQKEVDNEVSAGRAAKETQLLAWLAVLREEMMGNNIRCLLGTIQITASIGRTNDGIRMIMRGER